MPQSQSFCCSRVNICCRDHYRNRCTQIGGAALGHVFPVFVRITIFFFFFFFFSGKYSKHWVALLNASPETAQEICRRKRGTNFKLVPELLHPATGPLPDPKKEEITSKKISSLMVSASQGCTEPLNPDTPAGVEAGGHMAASQPLLLDPSSMGLGSHMKSPQRAGLHWWSHPWCRKASDILGLNHTPALGLDSAGSTARRSMGGC